MSRRGVVNVLLYAGLAILFVGSVLAAMATYAGYVAVALKPDRAFGDPRAVVDAAIVDNQAFWPSVTVTGEVAPGVRDMVTVSAGWWLISPLLVLALVAVVVAWRHRRRPASLVEPPTASEGSEADTQPIPVAR